MTTTPSGQTPQQPTPTTPAPGGTTPVPGTTTPAPGSTTPVPGTAATASSSSTSSSPASATSPVDTFVRGAMDAAKQARGQLAQAAQANRGRIVTSVDKLGQTVDSRTGGKYHRYVETAKGWVAKGVDAVAGTPGPTSTPGAASSSASSTTPAGGSAAPAPSPAAPAAPSTPREGWHRGPDGQWVKSS